MAKRKVRTKSSYSFFKLYKSKILIALSVLIGVVFIYFISTTLVSLDPIKKDKKLSMDSVRIDTVKTLSEKKNIRKIQVEILNGCGISNITNLFRDFFISNNIDIIAVGNYADFKQQKSFIIYHSYDVKEKAEELALKLNIDTKLVKSDIFQKPINELTLVLGFDYSKLNRN